MRNQTKLTTASPVRAAIVIALGLALSACASGTATQDQKMLEQASTDAAEAKADSARALGIMNEVKALNAQTLRASSDAAAAAKDAKAAAEKAARIAAELEKLYNKQLRK